MDLKSTYNKIAADWMNDHSNDTWWVDGTEHYLSFLKPGDSILDVGCGAGVKSDYLLRRDFEVTGIDFSEKMIELAKKRVAKGEFSVKDIKEPLGFDNQFEGVFAQAVLLHISKKEVVGVLKNLIAAIKEGGYLYIAVKELRDGRPEEEIVTENDYGYDYQRFFSYYTLEEMKKYLSEVEMKVVYETVTSSGKTNWIQIVAQK